jgi:hypothetical protein
VTTRRFDLVTAEVIFVLRAMRDERIESEEQRRRRCQQSLMRYFAEETKYQTEVDRLRGMLQHLAAVRHETNRTQQEELFQQYRKSLSSIVADTFRLTGREDGQPLAWAITWVDRDIWGDRPPPKQLGLAQHPERRSVVVPRTKPPEIIQSVAGTIPSFALWVSPTAVGLFDLQGDYFDDAELAAPEPDLHYLFDDAINDETWARLRQRAHDAVDRGIRIIRDQLEGQIPTGRRVRPKTEKSDEISLRKLSRYLLNVESFFDTTGPAGLRRVQAMAKLLGIEWPRLRSKTR